MKSTRVQALLVLAAGLLLGCVAASGSFLRGRQADAGPAKGSQGDAAEEIVFVVRLPADALLVIDDDKTTSTGEERRFRTPPLHVGGRYSYTLKASSNGKEVTRTIQLAHGADNTFDLRPDFRLAATARPHAGPMTGPSSSVVQTEGHNLIATDNRSNTLYFYTIDKDKEIGSDLKLRGSIDLSQVGKPSLRLNTAKGGE
jgi:uncharacterized protein (TIGR03000 family)